MAAAYGDQSRMEISDAIKREDNLCGDRFSSLPDALAYRVLSFVDVVDFDSLMEVSERWSRLCSSAPYLSMGNNTFTRVSTYRADFLGQYFSDRGKAAGAKIEKLRIVWSFLQPEPQGYGRGKRKRELNFDDRDAVFTCLRKCLSCCDPENVEVNLLLRDGDCCKSPLSLFFHKDIRNLVLSMNDSPLIIRNRYRLSTRLQNLTLKSVKIPSKSFGTLISQRRCPNLKQLRLYECSGMECLKFFNKSVEHVEIIQEKCSDLSQLAVLCVNLRTLLITWYPKSFTPRPLLELYVPKVEHLEWKGFHLRIFAFDLLEHLKSASIYCTWPTGKSLDKRYASDLAELFLAMRMTKSLRLLAKTIVILFSDDRTHRRELEFVLEGVETLHIDDCYITDAEVPAIASILKMMPQLKNVYVSFSKAIAHTLLPVSGFKMDYWEAQNMKSIKKLKTATLEIHEEGNATELVKYFAKHGERLKRLQVICPPAMVSAVSGQIELMKNLVGRSFKCDVQSSEL